ncbi:MAG: hypothetical protein WBL21_09395 [Salinimicrobium sp.]
MGNLQFISEFFYRSFSFKKSGRAGVVSVLIYLLLCLMLPQTLASQDSLFNSEEIFRIKLSGEIKELFRDRTGDPEYTPVVLSYSDTKGTEIKIPLKVRQRGHFRRMKSNCKYPPLLLNFVKKSTKKTIFDGQDKIKLVMPCKDDKYVLQEYYAYKIYNLVSPRSFRVRLVEVVLDDPALREKESLAFYGFLLEEEEQLAERNNMIPVKLTQLRPESTQREDFLNMAIFNYLIGKTDWSVQYRHNIKLIAEDSISLPVTVPYDFDHAGIVRAPYAHPAEGLELRSTLERRYRGYCLEDLRAFEAVVQKYVSIKEELYAVYTSSPLLEERYVRKTRQYLDDFYATLRDPEKLKKELQYPCLKGGTGNVVIRGLNN